MFNTWRRVAPFILAAVLLFDIAAAIVKGGQANWLMVGLVALALAASLWWRDQASKH